MAAAEYFSNAPMGPSHQTNPYQQQQYAQTTSSFPQPQHVSTQPLQQQPPAPPPYEAIPQGNRPAVHFADQSQRPHRHSFSSQAPIPVLAEQQQQQHQFNNVKPQSNYNHQQPPNRQQPQYSPQQQTFKPQPYYSPQLPPSRLQSNYSPVYHDAKPQPQPHAGGYHSQGYQQNAQNTSQRLASGNHTQNPQNPQFLSPYIQANHSQYALNGYNSDPEPHRRRRRRHSNDNRDSKGKGRQARKSVDDRSHKQRSRSTNADGFLGAAGGGLIGDLIFPGLGTVGGAVAGWIGGKDYGKHRKTREGKLDRDQEKWEHKFRRNSDEKASHRNHERQKHDY